MIIRKGKGCNQRSTGGKMSDKYEQAAREITCIVKDYENEIDVINAVLFYLRSQFHEPVKIDGVRYANLNRLVMMNKIEMFFGGERVLDMIESVHNFIDSTGMIRKGATSAQEGERVIIPFNMRDGLAICRGKGSKKYNYSAPHGAGRILSRSKAKATLDVEYFQEDMKQAGVYTTTANAQTLDESPDAYKDMGVILENIKETVDIIEMVKPVYNFKACDK